MNTFIIVTKLWGKTKIKQKQKKRVFIGAGFHPTPMLLLRGPQSTNSTIQIKDLESIEKVTKTLSEGFRSLRRNELRYTSKQNQIYWQP